MTVSTSSHRGDGETWGCEASKDGFSCDRAARKKKEKLFSRRFVPIIPNAVVCVSVPVCVCVSVPVCVYVCVLHAARETYPSRLLWAPGTS